MLILNTTYHVARPVTEDWEKWMKAEYVPNALKSGILTKPRFYRVFTENEDDTDTFALQFEVESTEKMQLWYEQSGKLLGNRIKNQFRDNVLGFTTVMEIIDI